MIKAGYTGLKLIHFMPKVVRWREKKQLPPPIKVAIDPAGVCNHRCLWCVYRMEEDKLRRHAGGVPRPPANFMEFRMIENIIRDAKALETRGISLEGGGEPTLHPDINVILDAIIMRGLYLGMVTNGSGLLKTWMKLREAAWVRVSFNAATKGTHEIIHAPTGTEDWEQVCAGTRALAEINPHVAISFYICPENTEDINKLPALARALRVRTIRYHVNYFNPVNLDWEKEVAGRLAAAQQLSDELQINMVNQYTDKWEAVVGASRPRTRRCWYSWMSTAIDSEGYVYPCCLLKYQPARAWGRVTAERRFWDVWREDRIMPQESMDPRQSCQHPCWFTEHCDLLDYALHSADDLNIYFP